MGSGISRAKTIRSRTHYPVCPRRVSIRLPWTRISPSWPSRPGRVTSLEAALPAEAPLGALTAQEIIVGQAEDAFCKERLT